MSEEKTETLYERIGGEPGIAKLVDSFYEKVMADKVLASYFKKVPMDRLVKMQKVFFSAATGGPHVYTGRSLSAVHKPLGISRYELKRFADVLIATLENEGLEQQDVNDIMAKINFHADEITTDVE